VVAPAPSESEIGSVALGTPSGPLGTPSSTLASSTVAPPNAEASSAAAHQSISASSTAVHPILLDSSAAAGQSALASSAAACRSILDSGAAGIGIAPGPPSVHPTLTAHGSVPPTAEASLLVGDLVEQRENVCFLANQEDGVEEEESVEDDGGIAQVAEVADKAVQAEDIFLVPGGLQTLLPYIDNNPHDIDTFSMAHLLFSPMTLIQLMTRKQE